MFCGRFLDFFSRRTSVCDTSCPTKQRRCARRVERRRNHGLTPPQTPIAPLSTPVSTPHDRRTRRIRSHACSGDASALAPTKRVTRKINVPLLSVPSTLSLSLDTGRTGVSCPTQRCDGNDAAGWRSPNVDATDSKLFSKDGRVLSKQWVNGNGADGLMPPDVDATDAELLSVSSYFL
mmetsp:Transcript_21942/g.44008  ORF Transcript_21942/g.44008 Transcript_21942/m.44008 type:complete len:178 (+) Transcript_21942:508-1041(+)